MPKLDLLPEEKRLIEEIRRSAPGMFDRTRWHPIMKLALDLAADGEGWRPELLPEHVKALEFSLAVCDVENQVGRATRDLIKVAAYLEDQQAGKIAQDLLEVCNNAVIKFALLERHRLAREKAEREEAEIKEMKEKLAASTAKKKT